jgi:ankyrin repeat protein
MFEACVYDDFNVVRGLMELIPDWVSVEDAHKNSPLCIAALHGSAVVLELLLYGGGKEIIDKENKHNLTPIDLACVRKHREAVLTLIAFGAEPSWEHAPGRFRDAVCKELEIRKKDSKISSLFTAVVEQRTEAVKKLLIEEGLEANANDPNADDTSFSLLHCAVAVPEPNLEMIKLLLDQGADLFHVDVDGDSALHVLCGRDGETNEDVLRLLLSRDTKGILLNTENKRGRLPLFNAAIAGNMSVCKVLLNQPGVDTAGITTRTDMDGKTCMYYANLGHAKDVCALFVQSGLGI